MNWNDIETLATQVRNGGTFCPHEHTISTERKPDPSAFLCEIDEVKLTCDDPDGVVELGRLALPVDATDKSDEIRFFVSSTRDRHLLDVARELVGDLLAAFGPSTDKVKRMDPVEFREAGYLQEVNRLVLHPLGLALEVVKYDDDHMQVGGIWDYRDDPEGMLFGDDITEAPEFTARAQRVAAEWDAKAPGRFERVGYVVQPLPGGVTTSLG